MKKQKTSFFLKEEIEEWQKEWQDMPEFSLSDLTPFKSITIHFACKKDMETFSKLIDQNITMKTDSRWFPENIHKGRNCNKRYIDET